MIILLCVFLGVMSVAVALTIFAIVRAKDGYEDETGFHFSGSAGEPDPMAGVALPSRLPMNAAARPFESESKQPATPELPPELLGAG